MPPSMMASAWGSRSTLAKKLVPRSNMCRCFAQPRCRIKRSGDNGNVAGAAAEMAAKKIAQRRFVGRGVVAQITVERHHDAGSAEAALQCVMAAERLLENGEAARFRGKVLDRTDRRTVRLHGERQAGARRNPVDLNRTGSTDAVFAT